MAAINKPFCIGLTGGIASGKTTVAAFFKKLGVPVIDADEISHQLTQPHQSAYHTIIEHFGKHILHENQTLNRKKLREKIFQNPEEKKWLENLLHPLIRDAMREKLSKINTPYCICVIPLLAESNGIDFIDHVLLVDAPVEMQIARAKKRDHTTETAIQQIIHTQASHAKRSSIADDVLTNNGDLQTLEKKVLVLHQNYLKLASSFPN